MRKIILSAFTAAIILVACTPKASPSKTNEIMPSVSDVNTEQAYISAGQTIFTTKCTKCHGAKTAYVNTHTYDEAKPVMAAMSQKAKLSDVEAKQLAAYVYANAKK